MSTQEQIDAFKDKRTKIDGRWFFKSGDRYRPLDDLGLSLSYNEIGEYVDYLERERDDINTEGNPI